MARTRGGTARAARDHLATILSSPCSDQRMLFAKALLVLLVQQQYREPTLQRILDECVERVPQVFSKLTTGAIANYRNSEVYGPVFREMAHAFPEAMQRPLRVAVVGGESLAYTKAIRDGFVEQMRSVYGERWTPVVDHLGSPMPDQLLKLAHSREALDVLVGVGTQGAQYLFERFPLEGDDRQQLLFLGVSDPVRSGLVGTLKAPRTRRIAGVGYGRGANELVEHIREVFPQQTLAFLYAPSVEQDRLMAEQLRGAPGVRLVVLDGPLRQHHFERPADVYFGWYALDRALERPDHSCVGILDSRVIVSTTLHNTWATGICAVSVGADDREIGRRGALLLARASNAGTHLGTMDVERPELRREVDHRRLNAIIRSQRSKG